MQNKDYPPSTAKNVAIFAAGRVVIPVSVRALKDARCRQAVQDMAGGELLLLRWRPRLPRVGEAHAA